mmetsp:Transcript_6062/g.14779  ORF Transcript_6062/g.14779 Transcript_6062/m.14779 type:complete len:84 (+) Transcript_6062:717-968(+)
MRSVLIMRPSVAILRLLGHVSVVMWMLLHYYLMLARTCEGLHSMRVVLHYTMLHFINMHLWSKCCSIVRCHLHYMKSIKLRRV